MKELQLDVCPSVCPSLFDVDVRGRIGWVSSKVIARDSKQLDPRCSMQTYHRQNQLH